MKDTKEQDGGVELGSPNFLRPTGAKMEIKLKKEIRKYWIYTSKNMLTFPLSWDDVETEKWIKGLSWWGSTKDFFILFYWFIYFLLAPWVMHLLSLVPSSCHAGFITISFLHSEVCLCSRNSFLPPWDQTLSQTAWHSISVPQHIKSRMRGSSDPCCFHKGCSDSHQRIQWIAGPFNSATWVSWEDYGSCWRWQHAELH